MALVLTDVEWILKTVAQFVAIKMNIPEIEIKSEQDIVNSIKDINPNVAVKLEGFLKIYRDWYKFHELIDKKEKRDNSDDLKILNLMKQRDEARTALIKCLEEFS